MSTLVTNSSSHFSIPVLTTSVIPLFSSSDTFSLAKCPYMYSRNFKIYTHITINAIQYNRCVCHKEFLFELFKEQWFHKIELFKKLLTTVGIKSHGLFIAILSIASKQPDPKSTQDFLLHVDSCCNNLCFCSFLSARRQIILIVQWSIFYCIYDIPPSLSLFNCTDTCGHHLHNNSSTSVVKYALLKCFC